MRTAIRQSARRVLLLGAAFAVALSVGLPTAAHAAFQRCDRHVLTMVFRVGIRNAGPSLPPYGDFNRLYCGGVPWFGPDLRVIPPGAIAVQVVAFSSDPGQVSLRGLANGDGIKLSKVDSPAPLSDLWVSPWIPIDPLQHGRLWASVSYDTTVYHIV
jgi:hypothetical protein